MFLRTRYVSGLFFLCSISFILAFADIATGSVKIPFSEILDFFTFRSPKVAGYRDIIVLFRIPETLTAALSGAAMGICGLDMQSFFRNPLAGPYVLGVGSAASLGAALVIFTGMISLRGHFILILFSTASALMMTLILLGLTAKLKSNTVLLLAGILSGYFTGAVTDIILRYSPPETVKSFINWTFGSFKNNSWENLRIFIPLLMILILINLVMFKPFNAVILGEDYAASLGINLKLFRLEVIVITSALTGAVTSLCGPIAFIGIASPHFARGFLGTGNHKYLMPGSVLSGMIFALTADIISSLPGGADFLPVNAVTSIIGVPALLWIIFKNRRSVQ